MKGMTMEIDYESTNKELAVRILGLVHIIKFAEEVDDFETSYDTMNELRQAALVLAERIVLDI